jgi:hypothetical protein
MVKTRRHERNYMDHKTLLLAYKDALATQRWDEVAPLIHEDACFIFSEGTYLGKAAIEPAVRATFDLIKSERYAIKDVVWTYVHEDSAACTYGFEWSGLIEVANRHRELGEAPRSLYGAENDGKSFTSTLDRLQPRRLEPWQSRNDSEESNDRTIDRKSPWDRDRPNRSLRSAAKSCAAEEH